VAVDQVSMDWLAKNLLRQGLTKFDGVSSEVLITTFQANLN